MPNRVLLNLETIDGTGLRFHVATATGQHAHLDSGEGRVAESPVEALLAALGGCEGMDVVSILRKKRQRVTAYEVELVGERREEHPRRFTRITIVHRLWGHDLNPSSVDEAIHLSETKYCTVRASLLPDIVVENRREILPAEPAAAPSASIAPPAPRRGLSELILRVADVARSVDFYRDVVGLSLERQDSPSWAWMWWGVPGALPRLGLTSRPLSFGAAHCGGPAHFAIAVPRAAIPAEKARLEALGIAVEGPVTFEAWQADSLYFSDPDHHRVELCGFAHLDPSEERAT